MAAPEEIEKDPPAPPMPALRDTSPPRDSSSVEPDSTLTLAPSTPFDVPATTLIPPAPDSLLTPVDSVKPPLVCKLSLDETVILPELPPVMPLPVFRRILPEV
jgi:hypothetical protein